VAEVRPTAALAPTYITGAGQDGDDRGIMLRRYLDVSSTGPAWYTTDPRVSPALARWYARARTNGGLAGTYGVRTYWPARPPVARLLLRSCSCARDPSPREYLRCRKYSAPRTALLAAVAAWCDDVEAGGTHRPGPAPTARRVEVGTRGH
jgi:hypothetical protein